MVKEMVLMPTPPGAGRDLEYEMRTEKSIAPTPPQEAGTIVQSAEKGVEAGRGFANAAIDWGQGVMNTVIDTSQMVLNKGFDIVKTPMALALVGTLTLGFIYRKDILKKFK